MRDRQGGDGQPALVRRVSMLVPVLGHGANNKTDFPAVRFGAGGALPLGMGNVVDGFNWPFAIHSGREQNRRCLDGYRARPSSGEWRALPCLSPQPPPLRVVRPISLLREK